MRHKRVVTNSGMMPGSPLAKRFETAPDTYEAIVFNAKPAVNDDCIMLSPLLSGERSFAPIVIRGDLMPTLMELQLDPVAGYLLQRAIEAIRDDIVFGRALSERRAA